MSGSADTPPPTTPDAPGGSDAVFQVAGTGAGNDGRWARGTVLINPSTGAPYAITEMVADSVALHDTDHPSRGASVTEDGALVVDGTATTQPVYAVGGSVAINDPNVTSRGATVTGAGALAVDGSGVTQPVSIAGTVDVHAVDSAPPVALYSHTFTATGTGTVVDGSGDPPVAYALQVSGVNNAGGSQTATSWTVRLQKSLDQVNWQNVLSHVSGTNADGAIITTIASPGVYMRASVEALTLGSAAGLLVSFVGKS